MYFFRSICAIIQSQIIYFATYFPFCFVLSVHKDISERLPQFNRSLYMQVKEVLDVNKAQRHIRGGIATREKYRELQASHHGLEGTP